MTTGCSSCSFGKVMAATTTRCVPATRCSSTLQRIIAETLAITDDMVAADLDLDQATASTGWWIRFLRAGLLLSLV